MIARSRKKNYLPDTETRENVAQMSPEYERLYEATIEVRHAALGVLLGNSDIQRDRLWNACEDIDAVLKEQQDATANAQAAFTANVPGPNGQQEDRYHGTTT